MRKLVVGVAVAALLVVPGSAAAKGPTALQLCGSSGCAPLGDAFPVSAGPAVPVAAPAVPAPYYGFTYDAPGNPFAYWIPSAGVVRLVDQGGIAQWVQVPADTAAKLQAVAQSLRPFPAPVAFEVVVNHHSVRRGATYGRLFGVGTPVRVWPRSVVWVPVKFFTTPGGPWGDGANSVWISTRGGYLMRDRQVVRISPVLARLVLARRPLQR